jgi:hypothetical protein
MLLPLQSFNHSTVKKIVFVINAVLMGQLLWLLSIQKETETIIKEEVTTESAPEEKWYSRKSWREIIRVNKDR